MTLLAHRVRAGIHRKHGTSHAGSSNLCKSDRVYNAMLDIFRERIILLEVLQYGRASPAQRRGPESDEVTREPSWKMFLNQLAWLCDHDKGGDSVSSIAVEGTVNGPRYWLSANFSKNERALRHLAMILEALAETSTLPLADCKSVGNMLLEKCIKFSDTKFDNYEKRLKTAIHYATISASQEEGDADVCATKRKLLMDTQAILALETRLERSISTFQYAKNSTLREIRRKHRDNAPNNAGSAWSDICHYLGRLGSWVRAVRVLIYFTRKHPQIVKDHCVSLIPSPRVCKISLSRCAPKVVEILKRILPEEESRAVRLSQQLDTLRVLDVEATFCERWTTGKKVMTRSHAELIVLDHFEHNDLTFSNGSRFIGSSRRSCHCCNLFFEIYNCGVATRVTHGNAWSKWCFPSRLERADKERLIKGQVTILERMSESLAADVLHLIEHGFLRRGRTKDSTTGMWTAPTLTPPMGCRKAGCSHHRPL